MRVTAAFLAVLFMPDPSASAQKCTVTVTSNQTVGLPSPQAKVTSRRKIKEIRRRLKDLDRTTAREMALGSFLVETTTACRLPERFWVQEGKIKIGEQFFYDEKDLESFLARLDFKYSLSGFRR